MCELKLVSKVVNVPLQSLDFRNVVLLFLLELLDHELRSTHVLFVVHTFLVKFVVVISHLFDAFLVSL